MVRNCCVVSSHCFNDSINPYMHLVSVLCKNDNLVHVAGLFRKVVTRQCVPCYKAGYSVLLQPLNNPGIENVTTMFLPCNKVDYNKNQWRSSRGSWGCPGTPTLLQGTPS